MKITTLIIAAAFAAIATPALALAISAPRVVVIPRAAVVIPNVTLPALTPRSKPSVRYNTPVYRKTPALPPYIGPARKCDRAGKVC